MKRPPVCAQKQKLPPEGSLVSGLSGGLLFTIVQVTIGSVFVPSRSLALSLLSLAFSFPPLPTPTPTATVPSPTHIKKAKTGGGGESESREWIVDENGSVATVHCCCQSLGSLV